MTANSLKLSKRQTEVLRYIKVHISMTGEAPTRGEIADALGLNSKAYASKIVWSLRDKGYIEIDAYEIRAIRIVKQN
jgi:SOS-response transcriptional repressor LexA